MDSQRLQRRFVTINEACKITGVSRRTVYNWIANYNIEIRRTPSGNPRLNIDQLLSSNNKQRNRKVNATNLETSR